MKGKSLSAVLLSLILLLGGFSKISGQEYISFLDPKTHPFNLASDAEIIVKDKGLSFVQLEFDISGAYASEVMVENEIYHYIHIDGLSKMNAAGSPALPVYYAMIAIPENASLSIEIIEEESTVHSGYMIHPALQPARDTYGAPEPEFELDMSVYNSNQWFPDKLADIHDIQKLKGLPIAQIGIMPVQFSPATGEIRVYSRLVCKLSFDGPDASFESIGSDFTRHSVNIIKNAVLNPTSIPEGQTRGPGDVGEKDYIIITHSEYAAAADSLARWKRQLGYSVEVVSQSSWTAAQVKTAIQTRYNSWTPKPDYFVIIGDHSGSYAVPGEIHQDPSYGNDFATDLYFACMDGGSDFYPDMAHGRISVSTAAEAMVVVQKIINYERNPVTTASYYENGLNCAQYQDDDDNTYADRRFCHTSENIRDYMQDDQGYTVERIYFTDSPDPTYYNNGYYSPANTMIPAELQAAGFNWSGDETDITSAINAGKFYVFHRDHGYTGGVGWHRPFYTTTTMNSLSNGDLLPVIFSINCHTGEFQLSNCFAEKLVRMESKGAVGVIAAAYYSYSGYNDGFSLGMINTIWPSPGLTASFGSGASPSAYGTQTSFFSMGDVMNQGLIRMAATWGNNRYTHELYHWFSDPALKIWTENPNPNAIAATYSSTINNGATTYSISSCSEADAVASLCQDGQLLDAITLTAGSGTLNFDPVSPTSDLVLTISKQDCKPLIDYISVVGCTFPVTNFSASSTSANTMSNISFSDLSACSPTSWRWNFPGGNPSYSEDQNPVIRYENPGTYDVVLTTTNAQGANTMIKASYIMINDTTYSYYMDDNCNSAGSWGMTTGSALWMNVDPTIPPDDHTGGGQCFITNGNDDYGTSQSYILTSPSVDLSGATGCELTFWMYLEQEGSNWDGGFIELFDGSTWNTIS
ncbi:MAG: C25 family cysteine peptidase, partial [Bacteroidota bacterium]